MPLANQGSAYCNIFCTVIAFRPRQSVIWKARGWVIRKEGFHHWNADFRVCLWRVLHRYERLQQERLVHALDLLSSLHVTLCHTQLSECSKHSELDTPKEAAACRLSLHCCPRCVEPTPSKVAMEANPRGYAHLRLLSIVCRCCSLSAVLGRGAYVELRYTPVRQRAVRLDGQAWALLTYSTVTLQYFNIMIEIKSYSLLIAACSGSTARFL